jgi:hypothetical protein
MKSGRRGGRAENQAEELAGRRDMKNGRGEEEANGFAERFL